MSHVSLGRPEFVPGTPPGHPTAKFLYVIFLYRFFPLHILDMFRAGQKTSKNVRNIFDTFRQFSRGTSFPAPLGGSDLGARTCLLRTGFFLPDLCILRSSLRAQTAKTLICTKRGVSADSRKNAKKCGKNRTLRKKCALLRKKCGFPHFLALFPESAETPPFVQINVFAVWALRLGRKYTIPDYTSQFYCSGINSCDNYTADYTT